MYFRALALVVAMVAAQFAWRAYADYAAHAATFTAFSKDWAPVATRTAMLMSPPIKKDAANGFATAKEMMLARAPLDGFSPELMLRRDLTP